MTSRPYPTTRRLFGRVFRALQVLGLGAVLSPMAFVLTAIYVSGLILLDRQQNSTRMADWLPARAHDALNRLLRTGSFSSRMVMGAVQNWASRLGRGYLTLVRHVALSLFAFIVLQRLRRHSKETSCGIFEYPGGTYTLSAMHKYETNATFALK